MKVKAVKSVISMEDIVGGVKKTENNKEKMEVDSAPLTLAKSPKSQQKSQKPESLVPRGKPKSGKFWKVEKKR